MIIIVEQSLHLQVMRDDQNDFNDLKQMVIMENQLLIGTVIFVEVAIIIYII